MSETALLVIDAQESFRHRPSFDENTITAYASRQQALIDGARAQNIPVVQVFHIEDDGPFAENSGLIRTLSPLHFAPDITFRKKRHSALIGTGLNVWLTQQRIHRLIVSGIRTEQCCETTTRHASDLGYDVDYVGEATATSALVDPQGHTWTAADLRARTELVLAGRFARIATLEQALAT